MVDDFRPGGPDGDSDDELAAPYGTGARYRPAEQPRSEYGYPDSWQPRSGSLDGLNPAPSLPSAPRSYDRGPVPEQPYVPKPPPMPGPPPLDGDAYHPHSVTQPLPSPGYGPGQSPGQPGVVGPSGPSRNGLPQAPAPSGHPTTPYGEPSPASPYGDPASYGGGGGSPFRDAAGSPAEGEASRYSRRPDAEEESSYRSEHSPFRPEAEPVRSDSPFRPEQSPFRDESRSYRGGEPGNATPAGPGAPPQAPPHGQGTQPAGGQGPVPGRPGGRGRPGPRSSVPSAGPNGLGGNGSGPHGPGPGGPAPGGPPVVAVGPQGPNPGRSNGSAPAGVGSNGTGGPAASNGTTPRTPAGGAPAQSGWNAAASPATERSPGPGNGAPGSLGVGSNGQPPVDRSVTGSGGSALAGSPGAAAQQTEGEQPRGRRRANVPEEQPVDGQAAVRTDSTDGRPDEGGQRPGARGSGSHRAGGASEAEPGAAPFATQPVSSSPVSGSSPGAGPSSAPSSGTTAAGGSRRPRRYRIHHLRELKDRGEKWAMLTAYDQYTAEVFDQAGIPVLLVGDSAANNVYGYESTLRVTVDELLPLARAVAGAVEHALVVADLPFGSYQGSPEQAFDTAVRFMKEAGVHAVKLEGGKAVVPAVAKLVHAGIPVMAHLGFTPQSEHSIGGYRVQGRGDQAAALLADAVALAEAGAFAVVLEMVPGELAADITRRIPVPTVGIGAGPDTDAQVLVWQDMAGLRSGPIPRFVKQYADVRGILTGAAEAFAAEVAAGTFPGEEHTF